MKEQESLGLFENVHEWHSNNFDDADGIVDEDKPSVHGCALILKSIFLLHGWWEEHV